MKTSKEKYGHEAQRMNFERANQYLQDLKEVFDKVDLKFFLFYGTLLGAIRDHDFVWIDHDVDVGILYEDAHKIYETEPLFKAKGYQLNLGDRLNGKTPHVGGYMSKKEYHEKVDFYALFLYKGDRCYHHYTRDGKSLFFTYPAKHFESFKEIEFKGAKYLVPDDPEGLLRYMWNDWEEPKGGQWGYNPHHIVPAGELIPEMKI